jgi:hypothetical protein
LPHRNTGKLDDLFIANVGVAMNADFGDDLGLRPTAMAVSIVLVNERSGFSLRLNWLLGWRRNLRRFGNPDERLDVGLLVIREAPRVRGFERAHRHRDTGMDVHLARQPDPGERLSHGHRRADVVDFDEPAGWKKVHPDVVEGVFDDLMFGGIDPESHERGLVHLTL